MIPSSQLDAKFQAATKIHFSDGGGWKSENKLSKEFKLAHRFAGLRNRECNVRNQEVQRKLTAILSGDVGGIPA